MESPPPLAFKIKFLPSINPKTKLFPLPGILVVSAAIAMRCTALPAPSEQPEEPSLVPVASGFPRQRQRSPRWTTAGPGRLGTSGHRRRKILN